jgi:hypothetical protein
MMPWERPPILTVLSSFERGPVNRRRDEHMNRRDFLKTVCVVSMAAVSGKGAAARPRKPEAKVMTVLGPIAPEEMGVTLPHASSSS